MAQDPSSTTLPTDGSSDELRLLRLLHGISQDFNSSLDFDELLPKVFNTVLSAVGAQGGSIWIAEGDVLRCRLALGAASQRLVGSEVPIGAGFVGDVARRQRSTIVTDAMQDPRFEARVDRSSTMVTTTVMAAPMVVKGETVGSIQVTNKVTGDRIFDERDREVLEGLAASAAIALRNAQLLQSEKRARNLALLLEISREITSTLDLDRVLHSVVNLATRALPFDRGAIGLYDAGRLDIRAIAGEEEVAPKAEPTRRLAARGTWALERGESFYLTDRARPISDGERAFVSAFGGDLAADDVGSGLYLPLIDEQGRLGVLVFEAAAAQFATETHRELAGVLANQTTVALRNAELYQQVPLAEMLGAIGRTRRSLLALPRRRRQAAVLGAVVLLAAITLIRWPLRVVAVDPVFRAGAHTPVRPLVEGSVERVLVREGEAVTRGDPLLELRTLELRGDREATAGALAVAERRAAAGAARGDAVEERLYRSQADAVTRELQLLDEQLAAATVRAPVAGLVLSPRPEDLVGRRPEAGETVLLIGRTDTLELEFGIRQRHLDRVRAGQEVRLRVDAHPQRTFNGRLTFVGPLPGETRSEPVFHARAAVANPGGELRPGMAAHARVLTADASFLGRVLRGPVRWARLLWWRIMP